MDKPICIHYTNSKTNIDTIIQTIIHTEPTEKGLQTLLNKGNPLGLYLLRKRREGRKRDEGKRVKKKGATTMIDLVLIPTLLGLAAGVVINAGIELYTDYKMEQERPGREAFFEALDRYHRHRCEGNGEKDLKHFRREVEKERGIYHDTGCYRQYDDLAKLGLHRSNRSRNYSAGRNVFEKQAIQLSNDSMRTAKQG